jgi:hypothetical protein
MREGTDIEAANRSNLPRCGQIAAACKSVSGELGSFRDGGCATRKSCLSPQCGSATWSTHPLEPRELEWLNAIGHFR